MLSYRSCFCPLVVVKFRRALEPSINAVPDGPRRKVTKASGNLLIGFSGGLGSTVLIDMVHRTYFSYRAPEIEMASGKLKGGKDHPRNDVVWPRAAICYVDVCNAVPGVRPPPLFFWFN